MWYLKKEPDREEKHFNYHPVPFFKKKQKELFYSVAI